MRLAIPLLLLVGAGCSSDHRSQSAETASGPSPTLVIVATGHGYEYPSRVPSGMTQVHFENRDTVTHEVMFIKLAPGMKAADYVAAVERGEDFPPGAEDCSGPGLTAPGEHVDAWLPLDPGEYFLGCWMHGHMAKAPVQTLTVTADTTRGIRPPPADVHVRLADFQFELADSVQKGWQVLRVENAGPSMHEIDIFRLAEGKTVADLRAWRKRHMTGEAPARAIGGVQDTHDLGRVVWLARDFAPGRYVMWCGMPMVTSDGNPGDTTHDVAGMVREFEVR